MIAALAPSRNDEWLAQYNRFGLSTNGFFRSSPALDFEFEFLSGSQKSEGDRLKLQGVLKVRLDASHADECDRMRPYVRNKVRVHSSHSCAMEQPCTR
jgi:hypothetical protein